MKQQITRISPFQTAKVLTLLALIVSALVVATAAAMFYFRFPQAEIPYQRALMMPFVYAAIAFVVSFISAIAYNLIARLVGGIEFTTAEKD